MALILPMGDEDALHRAARALRSGELVAFATDTVYGVGAVLTTEGTAAIFRAKRRPPDKPLPLLLSHSDPLATYALEVPDFAREVARRYWPGPLTLVLAGQPEIARIVGSSDGSIGFRVPRHPTLQTLIGLCGGALAVTSANLSGAGDALSAEGVAAQIGDVVTLILDGGVTPVSAPSTVLDLRAHPPRLLRRGVIGEELETLITSTTGAAEAREVNP